MSNYENHQLNYSKQSQELESKKRTFLFVVFMVCVAFAGSFFYKEIKNIPQKQVNISSKQKQSDESQNNRFFKNTVQTMNYVDKTPDEVPVPEEKSTEVNIQKNDDTVEADEKFLAQNKRSAEAAKIDEEKLALIGQERPKNLYKSPFLMDNFMIFPINLSWVEFIIRAGFIPVPGTIFSEESSETEENCVVRDYYYLKYNDKSDPRWSKIKFSTVKQSLDGKSVEFYEFSDDEKNKSFTWSIKVESDKIVYVNIKSIDVYKISLGDKKFLTTKNDDNFAEFVAEEKGFMVSSLIDSQKFIKTPYRINEDKEDQLYFPLATMLFETNNINFNFALYLESLRIEEMLKK